MYATMSETVLKFSIRLYIRYPQAWVSAEVKLRKHPGAGIDGEGISNTWALSNCAKISLV